MVTLGKTKGSNLLTNGDSRRPNQWVERWDDYRKFLVRLLPP